MALSPIGEAALIAREGRRLKAYRDSVGVWTIGIGITSASGLIKVTTGLTITAAECDALSRKAFAVYAGYVDHYLAGTKVPAHTYDALVSVCYNIGPGAFAGSTFLKRIKAGDLEGARAALLLWRKPAAVIGRRQAESDQLVTPYSVRLPEQTRGSGAIRLSAGAATSALAGAVSPAPTVPIRVAPRPAKPPTFALPGFLRAIGRVIDALFAPRLPAH